jgi:hypothetical protein
MAQLDIVGQRLHNQRIAWSAFAKPEEVVQWLGAVQAQDYAAAKWAIGLRLPNATDNLIDQAFAAGTILRTHVMRPTWHFVLPADIRWLLALTAPRVKASLAYGNRKSELDEAAFSRSNAVLVKALQGGKQCTRVELASALQLAGIATDDLRLAHIMAYAELDGIVCSGARRGKQFTYALLDERVPQTRTCSRDESLAELASRYFTSHGPATLHDFVWWSGLTVSDAKASLVMVASQLTHEVVNDQMYWFAPSAPSVEVSSPTAYLLPNYDEYIVGYTDRSAVFDAAHTEKLDSRGNVLFTHTIVLDGQIVGTWKRSINKDTVMLTAHPFAALNAVEQRAVIIAAERYSAFHERSMQISNAVAFAD